MFQRILSFLSKQKLEKFNFIKSVDNVWSRLFWIHFLENIVKQHVDYSKRYRFELPWKILFLFIERKRCGFINLLIHSSNFLVIVRVQLFHSLNANRGPLRAWNGFGRWLSVSLSIVVPLTSGGPDLSARITESWTRLHGAYLGVHSYSCVA